MGVRLPPSAGRLDKNLIPIVYSWVYSKILLATDGSENAIRASEHAAELTKRFGTQTTLVTAVYTPPMYSSDIAGVQEALLEDGARILEDTKRVFTRRDVSCSTRLIRWVHPVEAICKEAVEGKYDLVVLGRRGLNEQKRGLIGSVSEGILRSAPCAVLMVK